MSLDEDTSTIKDVNLTPLVDVIFTILVVFLVSIPMLTNTINVKLPTTAPTTDAVKVSDVQVSINAQSELFVNETKIAPNELESELKKLNVNGDLSVEILVDEVVYYREVAKALAQVNRAGISKFTFVILPEKITPAVN